VEDEANIVAMLDARRSQYIAGVSAERRLGLSASQIATARSLRATVESKLPTRFEPSRGASIEGWRALGAYIDLLPSSAAPAPAPSVNGPVLSLYSHNSAGLITIAYGRYDKPQLFVVSAQFEAKAKAVANPFAMLRAGPMGMMSQLAGEPAAKDWLAQYGYGDPDSIRAALHAFRAKFEPAWGPMLFQAAAATGAKPGERVTIIADGASAVLPLHLLRNPATGKTLLETYELVFAPSLDLIGPDAAEPTAKRAALGVQDAASGGPEFAQPEGIAIAPMFGEAKPTTPKDRAALFAKLSASNYWHFASHGSFDQQSPDHSALLVRPNAERTAWVRTPLSLTVSDIFSAGAALTPPRLVVLSACETNVVDLKGAADEFQGFPAAFLAMGARGVVGSLWQASDYATFLMMKKFYEGAQRDGLSPPAALRAAQLWLSTAEGPALAASVREAEASGALSATQAAALTTYVTREPGAAFADPVYWGAFTYRRS
jgi:hypothetical protein